MEIVSSTQRFIQYIIDGFSCKSLYAVYIHVFLSNKKWKEYMKQKCILQMITYYYEYTPILCAMVCKRDLNPNQKESILRVFNDLKIKKILTVQFKCNLEEIFQYIQKITVVYKDLFRQLKIRILNHNPNFRGQQEIITDKFLVLKK